MVRPHSSIARIWDTHGPHAGRQPGLGKFALTMRSWAITSTLAPDWRGSIRLMERPFSSRENTAQLVGKAFLLREIDLVRVVGREKARAHL